MRVVASKFLFTSIFAFLGIKASTSLLFFVSDTTPFVPLPSTENIHSTRLNSNTSVGNQFGASSSTQAYYFRQVNEYGQYGG